MAESTKTSFILEIENQRQRLFEQLHNSSSAARHLDALISFFAKFLSQPNQDRFQSYYLEFAPYCIHCVHSVERFQADPRQLEFLITILVQCRQWLTDTEWLNKAAAAEKKVKLNTALIYLYVADVASACRLLNWAINLAPASSEWTTAVALTEMAIRQGLPNSHELNQMVQPWHEGISSFVTESLSILLVEEGYTTSPQGRLLTLHLRAKERPLDAEEDAIKINNALPAGQASLYYALTDAARAVKRVVFSSQDRDVYYSYDFSFSEKEAEISGPSVGLAAGLLAFAGRHNRHYRRPLVKLSTSAAVIGRLDPDGAVRPVDEAGLLAKLQAAFFSPLQRLYLPADNLLSALAELNRLQRSYPQRSLEVIGLRSLSQAVHDRNLLQKKSPSLFIKAVATAQRTRHKTAILLAAALCLLIALFSQFPSLQWWRQRVPKQWEAIDDQFIMKDQYGKKLWSHSFDVQSKIFFSVDFVKIDDLDGDGNKETVLSLDVPSQSQMSSRIYCFSHQGKSLWPETKLGRRLMTKTDLVLNDVYHPGQIKIIQISPLHSKMVLAYASHRTDFPSVVALFDADGNQRGEYWSSGHIITMEAIDVDQDSIKEVLIGSYDNETGCARLIVLDPRDMHGASPQLKDKFILRDLAPGTQLACLRFPASPLHDLQYYRDVVMAIEPIDQNLGITIGNARQEPNPFPALPFGMYHYILSAKLEYIDMITPDHFLNGFHNTVGRELSAEDKAGLTRIEYWQGGRWVRRDD